MRCNRVEEKHQETRELGTHYCHVVGHEQHQQKEALGWHVD